MITVETYSKWKDIMIASFERTDRYIKACGHKDSKGKSNLDSKVN